MAERLVVEGLPATWAVAVPLHSSRLRQRGYNQSELLVTELRKLLTLSKPPGELVRTRPTPPQVGHDRRGYRARRNAGAVAPEREATASWPEERGRPQATNDLASVLSAGRVQSWASSRRVSASNSDMPSGLNLSSARRSQSSARISSFTDAPVNTITGV